MRALGSHLHFLIALMACIAAAACYGQPLPAGFAGSEKCAACHDAVAKSFGVTPHHLVETSKQKGWSGMACESCHGPGEKHAASANPADIRNPGKVAEDAQNQLCLTCHRDQDTPAGRISGGHAKNGPGCVACHSIHGEDHRPLVIRRAADINAKCASCHQAVWAQFQRPFRHRLPEGAMSCADCHNPHGSQAPLETQPLAFANEQGCLRCHSEYRGPFTYEHAPVRLEGCQACHKPHGSANPRMLTRHEVRVVCLECHANVPMQPPTGPVTALKQIGGVPPSFHDLSSPRYRNCTVCHSKIHGSYVTDTLTR
jgi:DmsE family decaheme c-type cytochrome